MRTLILVLCTILLLLFTAVGIVVSHILWEEFHNDHPITSRRHIWFLILHTEDQRALKLAICDTWIGSLRSPEEKYAFVISDPSMVRGRVKYDESTHILRVGGMCDNGADVAIFKTLYAWQWLLTQPNWEFAVRTNSHTYFQPEPLQRWLRGRPAQRLLAGPLDTHSNYGLFPSITYASGACMLMSKDVCQRVTTYGLEHYADLPVVYEDDVVLSHIAQHEIDQLSLLSMPQEDCSREDSELDATCWAFKVPTGAKRFYRLHHYLHES